MSQIDGAIQGFQRISRMIQGTQNPQVAIAQFIQSNPQMQQIVSMCNGKNPRDIFIQECKNRGLDPNETMKKFGLK